jgi:quercetin dioxygenase-like cupin family protein
MLRKRASFTVVPTFALSMAMILAGCSVTDAQDPGSSPTPWDTALDVTTINGDPLPAKMLPLQDVTTMLDTVVSGGNRQTVTQSTRKAGTRVAIHMHKYGGTTCVRSGEITDFVEGNKPMTWPAGTCYYMPPNVLMSAANLGTEDAVLIDTFIFPPGEPPITIREPGYPSATPKPSSS